MEENRRLQESNADLQLENTALLQKNQVSKFLVLNRFWVLVNYKTYLFPHSSLSFWSALPPLKVPKQFFTLYFLNIFIIYFLNIFII